MPIETSIDKYRETRRSFRPDTEEGLRNIEHRNFGHSEAKSTGVADQLNCRLFIEDRF